MAYLVQRSSLTRNRFVRCVVRHLRHGRICFLAVCNGCGACVSACANSLLHITQNKAELNIDYMACDLCGNCAAVCPTHALHPSFPTDTGLRPQFLADCIARQGQSCTTCQDSCPQVAILPDLTVREHYVMAVVSAR